MKMKIVAVMILISHCSSCILSRVDDSIDLGSKYRFIQDYPQAIIYHRTEKYMGTGVNIVDPIVVDYAFNDLYIIAKSSYYSGDGKPEIRSAKFWIVDKRQGDQKVAPMDSVSFEKACRDLNIQLQF